MANDSILKPCESFTFAVIWHQTCDYDALSHVYTIGRFLSKLVFGHSHEMFHRNASIFVPTRNWWAFTWKYCTLHSFKHTIQVETFNFQIYLFHHYLDSWKAFAYFIMVCFGSLQLMIWKLVRSMLFIPYNYVNLLFKSC